MEVTDGTDGASLLDRVIGAYLESGDFNGFYVGVGVLDEFTLREVRDLVSGGLIQVVSEEDYPNPHIRPWPSRRALEDQIQDVDRLIGA